MAVWARKTAKCIHNNIEYGTANNTYGNITNTAINKSNNSSNVYSKYGLQLTTTRKSPR